MAEPIIVPDAYTDHLEACRGSDRWIEQREEYFASRGLTELEYYQQILEAIEEITGPMLEWQRFYAIGAISGRGVERAQTRGRPHYHIVGLPCSVCGRR